MKNSLHNVFDGIHTGTEESDRFNGFLDQQDYSPNTQEAMTLDMRKFARWFSEANNEPFMVDRVTKRDVTDFRSHVRRKQGQSVSTANRALSTLRRYFGWLVEAGHATANPATGVKELRRQQLAPKGLQRPQVRKLLREIELRQDVRAAAIFSTFIYTGCRVSDVVNLELSDVVIGERSGSVVFRHGKGRKERTVPLPAAARQALAAYLKSRSANESERVFLGERGPLTRHGLTALCEKYGGICGFHLHPHQLRHTMAHRFLADNQNDLVSLSQILGHVSISTTARYTQRSQDELAAAAENLTY
jgi:integrase/recombinase XerC